ncbi:hypothetical protein AB5I41_08920 [Sphingomonas sp. MMS24-JH45]
MSAREARPTAKKALSSAMLGSILDELDDPLTTMMAEILRDFAADGILITQQDEQGASVVLFREGAFDWRERAATRSRRRWRVASSG